jgi:shikimate kinase
MKSNYILIGFMGVGKGTIARAYAKEHKLFAIDTDDLIESLTNKKIRDIFKDEGEGAFREYEKRCALWLESSVKNSIISTGGGFYKQKNLKKIGKVIYLKSSLEGIIKRIEKSPNAAKKIAKRPLLQNKKEAAKLFKIRAKEYKSVADYVIDVEDRSVEKIVKELHKIISI